MSKQLDVLFVHPNAAKKIYQDLSKDYSAYEPPIWALLLANHCRSRGFSAQLLDCEVEQLDNAQATTRIRNSNPRLIVFCVYGQQPSASTQNMQGAVELAEFYREWYPQFPIMFIGNHVSALPREVLSYDFVDFVAQNEGVYTLSQLLSTDLKTDLYKVAGLGWKEDGKIGLNGIGPIVPQDRLEVDLPGPALDLVDLSKYRTANWHVNFADHTAKSPFYSTYTSLGCYANCSFCLNNIINRTEQGEHVHAAHSNIFRYWSPEFTIKQFEAAAARGVKNVKIADEMFVYKPKHFLRLCELLIERDFGFNIWVYARVSTLKEKYLEKLKAAGVNWIGLGIESGNQLIRDEVEKGVFKDVDIRDVVSKTRSAGLNVTGNYIFGLPEETHQTMQETLDLALELNTEYANLYCFPSGTNIWTPSGLRHINSIKTGDKVFGLSGEVEVKHTISRYYNGDLIRIKPRYLPVIKCTPEHPMYVAELYRTTRNKIIIGDKSFIEANKIIPFNKYDLMQPYHALVISKNNFNRQDTYLDLSKYVKGQVGGGRVGGQLVPRGKKYLEPWLVTEELAEFFGWYVAEGSKASNKHNRLCFSMSQDEPENVDRVRFLIRECFDLSSVVRNSKKSRALHITFMSKVLIRAIHDICGKTANTKYVPDFIMNAKNNIVKAFLKGYIGGDGTSWANKTGQFSCSSASKKLSNQISMLFFKIGKIAGLIDSPPKIGVCRERKVYTNTQYRVSWIEDHQRKNYREDDHYFYLPIQSIDNFPYSGMVHNLATTDETYSTPFLTHNCAMAYPGSPLHIMAKQDGKRLPATFDGYSQHSYNCTPLAGINLSAAEILRFRDRAFDVYFTNPDYLNMMESKFGTTCRRNIEEMTRIKLRRRLLDEESYTLANHVVH